MGNWRTIQITGTCAPEEVSALRKHIDYHNFDRHFEEEGTFGPLSSTGGLAGLPLWPATDINAVGNCAERGYDPDDIADQLRTLAQIAPSLSLRVNCGGDYESLDCVATVTLEAGEATVGDPQVEEIPGIPEGQMMTNFYAALTRR